MTVFRKHSVVSEVECSLQRAGIEHVDRLLVACSGGADSTALLSALFEVRDSSSSAIAACYFDHGLRDRDEVYREQELLRKTCRRLGIELLSGGVEPGVIDRIASTARRGIEDACREERYRFLHRTMQDGGFIRILLGHTRNDQAETVIQRLFEGSGPGGISGIPADEPPLLRPLINVERSEIVDYLELRSIEYSVDSSNLSGRFLRNRIRSELIPIISDIFPGYLRGIEAQAEKANLADLYMRSEFGTRIPLLQTADYPEVSIDRESFYRAPPVLRLYALYSAFNRVNKRSNQSVDRVPYRAIRSWALAADDGIGENRILLRTKNYEVERNGHRLAIRSRVVFDDEKSYLWIVHEPGEHELSIGEMRLLISEIAPQYPDWIEILVSGFPVVFRSYLSADTMFFRQHRRRVSELFPDFGKSDRRKTLVIEDRTGIVAAVNGDKTVVRDSVGFVCRLYARITHVKDERFGYERTGKAEQSRRQTHPPF